MTMITTTYYNDSDNHEHNDDADNDKNNHGTMVTVKVLGFVFATIMKW